MLQQQLSKAAAENQGEINKDTNKDMERTAQRKTAKKIQQVSSVDPADIALDHLPIFDRADLVQRMGGEGEGLDEFMTNLPGYLSEDIRELKAALSKTDLEGILCISHKIKGMSANASAERVREVVFRIESAAQKGDINVALSLFNLLEQQEEDLREFLAQKNS